MGIDPMTHQPRTDIFASLPHLIALAQLKDLIENHHQIDELQAVRFQAEAIQVAKLQYLEYLLQSATPPSIPATTNPNPQNGINPDMDSLNHLLNSIMNDPSANVKESPSTGPNTTSHWFSQLGINTTTAAQPLHHAGGDVLLSHLPTADDPLQVPFTFQTPLNNLDHNRDSNNNNHHHNNNNNNNGPGYDHSSLILPSLVSSNPLDHPSVTETTMTTATAATPLMNINPGDASSATTSSHGGAGGGGGSHNSSSFWSELYFEDPIMNGISN